MCLCQLFVTLNCCKNALELLITATCVYLFTLRCSTVALQSVRSRWQRVVSTRRMSRTTAWKTTSVCLGSSATSVDSSLRERSWRPLETPTMKDVSTAPSASECFLGPDPKFHEKTSNLFGANDMASKHSWCNSWNHYCSKTEIVIVNSNLLKTCLNTYFSLLKNSHHLLLLAPKNITRSCFVFENVTLVVCLLW